eukprot:TRINITY_DN12233_c0_g1_i1.p1 TRINITY_DN12233_c0_g1~~TRINITY_DN12233_c0_g1_i1.p1  ORF type:complete len:151 (-),score=9.36 TRINITY_DN12233_c0_g1_i1:646-1062(-)
MNKVSSARVARLWAEREECDADYHPGMDQCVFESERKQARRLDWLSSCASSNVQQCAANALLPRLYAQLPSLLGGLYPFMDNVSAQNELIAAVAQMSFSAADENLDEEILLIAVPSIAMNCLKSCQEFQAYLARNTAT